MPRLAVQSAYYASTITDFINESADALIGALASKHPFALDATQRDAWLAEVSILRTALQSIDGAVLLEFDVPRIGSRIDAVVLTASAIIVIEFKVGETRVNTHDFNQAWDYALDLKNFHLGSHGVPIVPILVPTDMATAPVMRTAPAADGVFRPLCCNSDMLVETVRHALEVVPHGITLDPVAWARAPYKPTPSIVEAAQALYARHSVESIARHDAGAQNLAVTSTRVQEIVELARAEHRKAIVFVTGVPGAGKTLVGLNVATVRRDAGATHAVYLSGNGPLVSVLREALTRDEVARLRAGGSKTRKGVVQQSVKSFIQNVHHFRDAGLNEDGPPADHVVIFDEAQRAWNREMTADFMKRKKGKEGLSESEPEMLLAYVDRHTDWAVVVCLVGGGQEINRGEGGISEWLDALSARFPSWQVFISPNLFDSEYGVGRALKASERSTAVPDARLHLAVSMRSFRTEHLSRFVKAVLDCEASEAQELFRALNSRYPIAITRDLTRAKDWIRSRARGSERYGLIASSGAQRLKAACIDVRVKIDPVKWFLNDLDDVRSSCSLEDPATEFQVQGLELDWACVGWDADFRFAPTGWTCHSFVGSRWQAMKKPDRRRYLLNAYRVLMTRARQGMVIFVPRGNAEDPTRVPLYYDGTFDYLKGLGVPEV